MSSENLKTLVAYRVDQADESLKSARLLLEDDLLRSALNRAYYAMFYAILALLASQKKETSKHAGAIALFDRDYVKSGIFPRELSRWVHDGFDLTQRSDYAARYVPSREETEELINNAASFVRQMRQWRPAMAASGGISGAVSTGSPWEVPFGPHRLIFEEPIPGWSRPLLLKISALGGLDENWDSYGARPIDPCCALTAAELILNLLDSDGPQPAVVPTTRGGIQLEWHRAGANLEVEVTSYGRLSVFFEDERTGEEQQLLLSGDLSALDPLSDRVAG